MARALHILLVEDEPGMRALVGQMLQHLGHTYEQVQTGAEALYHGLARRHDVIVLDLVLPDLSGGEVLKQLRRQGVRTPVVMASALDDEELIESYLAAGATAYLLKPFPLEALSSTLERIQAAAPV